MRHWDADSTVFALALPGLRKGTYDSVGLCHASSGPCWAVVDQVAHLPGQNVETLDLAIADYATNTTANNYR